MSTETPDLETIKLPSPRFSSDVSLEQVLARRRSVREFTDRALTDQEISQLLWSAQGTTSRKGLRTAPSAGGLLPLELYVALPLGLFHYEPASHLLRRSSERDLRIGLCRAALDQEVLEQAPAVFVVAAVFERITEKYGSRRGLRYVHMEVGHSAQNLLLQAVGLGLGGVVVGAFHDRQVQTALSLPASHRPLYLVAVGEPYRA